MSSTVTAAEKYKVKDISLADWGREEIILAANILHHSAGHAGKIQQTGHIHFGQRTDDFMYITAGTEISALAGNYYGPDRVISHQSAE